MTTLDTFPPELMELIFRYVGTECELLISLRSSLTPQWHSYIDALLFQKLIFIDDTAQDCRFFSVSNITGIYIPDHCELIIDYDQMPKLSPFKHYIKDLQFSGLPKNDRDGEKTEALMCQISDFIESLPHLETLHSSTQIPRVDKKLKNLSLMRESTNLDRFNCAKLEYLGLVAMNDEVGIDKNDLSRLKSLFVRGSSVEIDAKKWNLRNLESLSLEYDNNPTEMNNFQADYLPKLASLQVRNKLESFPDLSSFVNLTSIKLNKCSLYEIGKWALKLSHLKSMDLKCNDIEEIENLDNSRKLEYLDLSQNDIQVVQGLDSLVSLKTLNLSENRHLEKFEYFPKSLSCLEKLDLHEVPLDSICEFQDFPKLKEIDFKYTYVRDVKGLRSLESLEKFTGALHKIELSVNKLENLTYFHIIRSKLDKEQLQTISQLNNVKSLKLTQCHLEEIGTWISPLTQLKSLELSSNSIKRITNLERLQDLEEINLKWNEIEALEGVESLKKLTKLIISCNNISKVPANLSKLSSLKELDLSNNKLTTWENLNDLPALKTFNLTANEGLSVFDKPLNFPKLIKLELVRCPIVKLENFVNVPSLEIFLAKRTKFQSMADVFDVFSENSLKNMKYLQVDLETTKEFKQMKQVKREEGVDPIKFMLHAYSIGIKLMFEKVFERNENLVVACEWGQSTRTKEFRRITDMRRCLARSD
ncbi:hypothetical protein DASC09_017780 [Saccharomycopsis crataegensis]|uniref:F-box domain-containing protein n=1 Tax=Saccharomycopsis crataegensis TaxID=43959 RepID=A0AAV5QJY3_9ASCO|nr:hypothetical protein DASC09_017780 [Saccharomycopsis crataegensis]